MTSEFLHFFYAKGGHQSDPSDISLSLILLGAGSHVRQSCAQVSHVPSSIRKDALIRRAGALRALRGGWEKNT